MFLDTEFVSNYISSKITSDEVSWELDSLKLLNMAESKDKLYRLDGSTTYSINKTLYDGKRAVVIVFNIELRGPIRGSSTDTTSIMTLFSEIEKKIGMPIYRHLYKQSYGISKKKIYGFLKIVKLIEETDIY
jgi:hypothetical protein